MHLSRSGSISCDNATKLLLLQARRDSAMVYNYTLEMARYCWRATRKNLSSTELQKRCKCLNNRVVIPSQSIQSACQLYAEARSAAYEARKGNPRARYPWKTKHHMPAVWKDKAFRISSDGTVELGFGIKNGKQQPWRTVRIDPALLNGVDINTIKEIQFDWDGGLRLSFAYDDGLPGYQVEAGHAAAGDLGEINSVVIVDEEGASLQVNGRASRSIKRYRIRKQRSLDKSISRCKKGSRNWRKRRAARARLFAKTEKQLMHLDHAATRKVAQWCEDHHVAELVVGDIEGVQRNTRKNKRCGKKQRTRLSLWRFGVFVALLSYKLNRLGIELLKQDESFSTQQCPCCGTRYKPKGRVYICKKPGCGYRRPRDHHGAANQLAKHLFGVYCLVALNRDRTYLQPIRVNSVRRR